MDVGQAVRMVRQASGLKQRDLAEKLDLSANYLSLVESGRREPSLTVLKKMSRQLGVPLAFFFWDSDVDEDRLEAAERRIVDRLRSLILEFQVARVQSRAASPKHEGANPP